MADAETVGAVERRSQASARSYSADGLFARQADPLELGERQKGVEQVRLDVEGGCVVRLGVRAALLRLERLAPAAEARARSLAPRGEALECAGRQLRR